MHYLKVFPLAALLVSPVVFSAKDSYRFDFSADYHASDDSGSGSTVYSLSGSYCFTPLETRDSPYAEVAFLERASSVSLAASKGKEDRDDLSSEYTDDEKLFLVKINLARPNQDFTVRLDYLMTKSEERSGDR